MAISAIGVSLFVRRLEESRFAWHACRLEVSQELPVHRVAKFLIVGATVAYACSPSWGHAFTCGKSAPISPGGQRLRIRS